MKTDIKIEWLKAELTGLQAEVTRILKELEKGSG